MDGIIDLFPIDYGYVIVVIVLFCFLNLFMQIQVGKARKMYKVFYPTLYAKEAENKEAMLFNCIQRGHQNTLENMPVFFVHMILGGIKHPTVAASLGLLYTLCRLLYFTGYATGVPDKRVGPGITGNLALLGLFGCTISFAVTLLMD